MPSWVLPLAVVFAGGGLATVLRLPALVGFLAAGFALNAAGVSPIDGLDTVADLGVALLLFGIGIKLDLRLMLRREVVATTWVHLALSVAGVSVVLAAAAFLGVTVLADAGTGGVLLVAFALSFSSTVAVVAVLEGRNQSRSFYGRVAIGILVWQDLAAVVFIVLTADEPPSPWAVLLLLLVFLRRPAYWVLARLGHNEMRLLFGLFLGLVLGYGLFEAAGLDGDLGALLVGLVLGGHPQSFDLAKQVTPIKNLFLVGFFLSIGYTSELTTQAVVLGLAFVLLIPLQTVAYTFLLRWNRLRRRTSALISLALANNSEFGLIVATVGVSARILDEQWLAILSVAVGGGMVLGALLNQWSEPVVRLLARLLPAADEDDLHPDDRPVQLADAEVLVLGLGRVGMSACRRLTEDGYAVLGVESDPSRVHHLSERDFGVVEADATDEEFWQRVVDADTVRAVVLAMPFHSSNLTALARLEAVGFSGSVVAAVRYDDDVPKLVQAGADEVLQVYEGAGDELADRVARALDDR